jgi:chromosome segregation ATPase
LQYKNESIQLAATGEALEIENKDLLRKITELSAERERLEGKAEEQEVMIQKLSRKLDSEIRICEQVRVTAQSLKAEITLIREKMTEREKSIKVLTKDLEKEREARATLEQANADLLGKLEARGGAVTTGKQRPNKKAPPNA